MLPLMRLSTHPSVLGDLHSAFSVLPLTVAFEALDFPALAGALETALQALGSSSALHGVFTSSMKVRALEDGLISVRHCTAATRHSAQPMYKTSTNQCLRCHRHQTVCS
jgi:hypothetical protein